MCIAHMHSGMTVTLSGVLCAGSCPLCVLPALSSTLQSLDLGFLLDVCFHVQSVLTPLRVWDDQDPIIAGFDGSHVEFFGQVCSSPCSVILVAQHACM